MALKPDREEMFFDVNNYCNVVSEMGGIVSAVSPGGSGGYPGDKKNQVSYAANPSGAKPMGLLLQNVVDLDTNRLHENWEQAGFNALKGQKVTLAKDGWYTTNMIPTGVSPAMGDPAYLAASGMISNSQASGAPKVGQFQSAKDADGYARVRINLQP
jgi:hypothetical protein